MERKLVCAQCGRGPETGAMLFGNWSDPIRRKGQYLDRPRPDYFCARHAPSDAPKTMVKAIDKARARWGEANLVEGRAA